MEVILVDRVLSVATATTAAQPEPTEGLLDNWLAEPFVVLTTSPGSPYEPRTFEFPVRNVDARRRFVTMAFDGLPTSLDPQVAGRNWRLKLDPPFASLCEGQSQRFALSIQPPDPPEYKGGIQTVGALGFMNHLDAVIPMDRLDVHVVAAARSMLTVSMDAKGSLEGQLTYRTLSGAVANAPAGLPIHLTVSGSDGVNLTYVPGEAGHGALTQAGGRYQQAAPASFQPRGGVRYQVVAEWMGNPELAPARAEALYESPKSERGADLVPSAIRLADLARRRVSVRVRNAGDAPIRGARLALFWSKDEHASPDDRPTGEAPIPALKPGRGADVRVALPPASAGGPYLIAVCVPARPSDERNLLNNALAQALAR